MTNNNISNLFSSEIILSHYAYGIHFQDSNGNIVKYNTLNSNQGGSRGVGTGISLDSSSDNELVDNEVCDNKWADFSCFNSDTNTADGNTFDTKAGCGVWVDANKQACPLTP